MELCLISEATSLQSLSISRSSSLTWASGVTLSISFLPTFSDYNRSTDFLLVSFINYESVMPSLVGSSVAIKSNSKTVGVFSIYNDTAIKIPLSSLPSSISYTIPNNLTVLNILNPYTTGGSTALYLSLSIYTMVEGAEAIKEQGSIEKVYSVGGYSGVSQSVGVGILSSGSVEISISSPSRGLYRDV